MCGTSTEADVTSWLQRRITAFAISNCTIKTTTALFDEIKIWLQHSKLLTFLATQDHQVQQSHATQLVEIPHLPLPLRFGMTANDFEAYQLRTKEEEKIKAEAERLRLIHSRKRATSVSHRRILESTAQNALSLQTEVVQLDQLPDLVSRIVSLSVEAMSVTLVRRISC